MQPEQVARLSSSKVGLAFNLLAMCCVCGACNQPAKRMGLECEQGAVCKDTDCDTICDDAEDAKHARDTDRDGTPDFEDLDSDADGIPDLEEAGDDDPATPPFDRNLDGKADYTDKHYPLDAGKDRPLPGSSSTTMAISAPEDAAAGEPPPSAACSADAGCEREFSCPSPGDPRIPDARLYVPYLLDAAEIYGGDDVQGYNWYVSGSPCDRLYAELDPDATTTSGKLSVTLTDSSQRVAEALFTTPGEYDVVLRIVTKGGDLWCSFKLHVAAPGIRVELCWDKTGPTARGDAVDLDLHLAKPAETAEFFSADDCYSDTCLAADTPWNYASTAPLPLCTGASAQNYAAYASIGACPNPRLDINNRLDQLSASRYLTETIALDAPVAGDRFRVMVHYAASTNAGDDGEDAGMPAARETHPIVNVYCDGTLSGTFGGIPDVLGDPEEVGLSYQGQMWRVADIVSADGTCNVAALTSPETGSGYWVSTIDASYGH
jgi:hypothetical protein